jgi:alkylhydroperoxidase/carboxymuconolactone decarboxylase family protein YurZ
LASKLGVEVQAGDEDLPAEDLTNVFIQRAKDAGKSESEISQALAE